MTRDYEAIKVVQNIEEAIRVFEAGARQIFYYDDFLGQTSLAVKLGKNEDESLMRFFEAVQNSRTSRLILTTREYILKQAQGTYEKLTRPNVDLARCIVDLSDYTQFMRAQILYNHLYFSKLPDDYRSALLEGKAYRRIVDHRNYSPRIVEWMTEWQNLNDIAPSGYLATFLSNLDNPRQLWLHAFENQILDASRHLLLVMSTFWFDPCLDVLEEAFLAFHSQQANKHHMETGSRDFRRALKELDGTFLRMRTNDSSGCITVVFHNPSVRDFLQSYLDEERELTRDLVGSAILHGQIRQLWGVSPWHSNPQTREWLASDETVLVESLLRTLGSKATVFQRMAGRVVSLERDVPMEARLVLVLRIAHDVKTPAMITVVNKSVDYLAEFLKNSENLDVDCDRLLATLSWVKRDKDRIVSADRLECLLSVTRDILWRVFDWTPCTLSDFDRALSFRKEFPNVVSPKEYQSLRERFPQFADGELYEDASALRSSSDVEHYIMDLDRLAAALDLNGCPFDLAELEALKEDLACSEDARADSLQGRSLLDDSPQDVDRGAIDSMFESLLHAS